jgi:serine phosphatase RsbU (regulator of sigma subunit)
MPTSAWPGRAARAVPCRQSQKTTRNWCASSSLRPSTYGLKPSTSDERPPTASATSTNSGEREHQHERLIARLRQEADVRDEDLAALRAHLEATDRELEDLRAIRDALTPPELPHQAGLDLAAAFLPAAAGSVSGDFYPVADGPRECTVLVVGDAVGHGLQAARRAAFVRTAFITTAPFTDDPARLLSWVNTAMTERAGTSAEFVTAACITYLPGEQRLHWAYAGHPPAMWLDTGEELLSAEQGMPLGLDHDLECVEGSRQCEAGEGLLLYTDGLTEARRDGEQFGLKGVREALADVRHPSPAEVVAILRSRVADFAYGTLTDDLCLLAARIG